MGLILFPKAVWAYICLLDHILYRITINNQEYTFGHGGRHVKEWSLNHLDVEKAIADKMSGLKNIVWSKNFYKDHIVINGVKVEFHAQKLPNGKINIGTYFGPRKDLP